MNILYYFKKHRGIPPRFWAEIDGELWGFVQPIPGASGRDTELGMVGPYPIFKDFGCVNTHDPGRFTWIFTAEIIEARLTGNGPDWVFNQQEEVL